MLNQVLIANMEQRLNVDLMGVIRLKISFDFNIIILEWPFARWAVRIKLSFDISSEMQWHLDVILTLTAFTVNLKLIKLSVVNASQPKETKVILFGTH